MLYANFKISRDALQTSLLPSASLSFTSGGFCIFLHFLLFEILGELVKIQEAAYCKLLLLEHGSKPHRPRSNKAHLKEKALKEAWLRLGDLSILPKEKRIKKIRSFLQTVDPFTILDCGKHTIEVIKIPYYSHSIQLQKNLPYFRNRYS